jgi:hypothetical protein
MPSFFSGVEFLLPRETQYKQRETALLRTTSSCCVNLGDKNTLYRKDARAQHWQCALKTKELVKERTNNNNITNQSYAAAAAVAATREAAVAVAAAAAARRRAARPNRAA